MITIIIGRPALGTGLRRAARHGDGRGAGRGTNGREMCVYIYIYIYIYCVMIIMVIITIMVIIITTIMIITNGVSSVQFRAPGARRRTWQFREGQFSSVQGAWRQTPGTNGVSTNKAGRHLLRQ